MYTLKDFAFRIDHQACGEEAKKKRATLSPESANELLNEAIANLYTIGLSVTREHAGNSPELERLLDMIERRVLEFHRRHVVVDAGLTGRTVSPRLQ